MTRTKEARAEDERTKPSMKQEDAVMEQRNEGKHIKAEVEE